MHDRTPSLLIPYRYQVGCDCASVSVWNAVLLARETDGEKALVSYDVVQYNISYRLATLYR
jgi:hypothetical protein